MKKTYILLAAAVLTASCQKETGRSDNPSVKYELSSLTAVAQAIGEPSSKVEMSHSFEVLWQKDDSIYVTDGQNHNTFKLQSGEGQTRGIFTQDTPASSFTDAVQAYYPASLVSGSTLVWPANQPPDHLTMPMYSTATLSGSEAEEFDFSALGGILQIVFNSTVDNSTLLSIEISDGKKPLSGEFTIDGGKAVITSSNLNAGITLDFGTGVSLGKGVHYFNVAVPEGNYENLTITYRAKSSKESTAFYTNSDCKANVVQNTVVRLVQSSGFLVPATGVALDITSKDIDFKDKFTIKATVYPSDATNKKVKWESDNPDIATVDQNGIVTGKGYGTATITATSDDNGTKSASCSCNVNHKITKGEIDGHPYVQIDDGLKWATENIKDSNDRILYFFWGGVEGYYFFLVEHDIWNEFGWKSCEDDKELAGGFWSLRYHWHKTGSDFDDNIPVNAEYDAARALWGEHWRLPTAEEFTDLYSITESKVEGDMVYLSVPKFGNNAPKPVNTFALNGYADGDWIRGGDNKKSYFYTSTFKEKITMQVSNLAEKVPLAKGMAGYFDGTGFHGVSSLEYPYQGCPIRPVVSD